MSGTIKISELSELVSGSITGTDIIPIVNSGETFKTKISSILSYMDDTLASDSQLSSQISTLDSRIGIVEDNLDSIIDVGVPAGTVSSSAQIDYLAIQNKVSITGSGGIGITLSGSNQFTASLLESYLPVSTYQTDSASFQSRISSSQASISSIQTDYAVKAGSNTFSGENLFQGITEFDNTVIVTTIVNDASPTSILTFTGGSTNLFNSVKLSLTGSVEVATGMKVDGMLSSPQYPDSSTGSLSHRAGSVIWNTTRNKLQVFNGSSWEDLH